MGKNIVLCLDGTWNGPNALDRSGNLTPTNVQKLFESLKGSAKLGAALPLDSGPGEERMIGSRPEPETKICMPSNTRRPFFWLKPFSRKVLRKRPLCDLPLARARLLAPLSGLGGPVASA